MRAGTLQYCCRTPCKACLQYAVMVQLKFLCLQAVSSKVRRYDSHRAGICISSCCLLGYRCAEKGVIATILLFMHLKARKQ